MSSDDRDVPEFDDFDLPDDMPQPGDQSRERPDEWAEPAEPTVGPGEETTGPSEGTTPGSVAPTEEYTGPLPEGLAAVPLGETEPESTEEEEEEKEEKKKRNRAAEGFLKNLAAASPFTVMLAVSLTAILLSILLLFIELQHYNFDIKAKEAEQRVGAAPAVQLASPSTTAAA